MTASIRTSSTADRNRKRTFSALRTPSWNLAQLEERIMLAADVGAAVATVPATASHATTSSLTSDASKSLHQSNTRALVVVDYRVENIELLQSGVADGAEMIVVNKDQDAIGLIQQIMQSRQDNVASLHIVCHGNDGELVLGDRTIDHAQLQARSVELQSWADKLTADADIMLYGCNVTASDHGIQFIKTMADLTGADVAASSDHTGDSDSGANWVLENTTGQIDVALVFDSSARRSYQHTLNIVVNAWGQTGDEQFDLQIDGQTVQTYHADTTWTPFVYETNEAISADRVRIRFTNDAYDPQTGYDRNLFVSNIQASGENAETNSDETFSTGTWTSQDGIQPGYGRGIVLHGNGYFQYWADVPQQGTRVTVQAEGTTGDEILQIRSESGDLIGEFQVSTESEEYVVSTEQTLSLTDIRVDFINDAYDPANDYDRNLIVSSVLVDDIENGRSDSVSLTNGNNFVFSTGTWVSGEGIVEGFGRGDTLHSDGYLSFGHSMIGGNSVQLDSSFGNGGEVETTQTTVIATDDTGRVASSGIDSIEVRDASGNLDSQFAGDGIVSLGELIGPNLQGYNGVEQSRILVTDLEYTNRGLLAAGFYQQQSGFEQPTSIFVVLLNSDGTLVDDYVNGVVEGPDIELSRFAERVRATMDSANRTILVSETANQNPEGGLPDLGVSRLDASGSIDTSFGNGGTTVVDRPFDAPVPFTQIVDVLQTSDGGYLFGAAAIGDTAISKLDADGNLDLSFGDLGVVVLDVDAKDVSLDQQDRIIAAGNGQLTEEQGYAAFRLQSNGDLDSSFGDSGFAFAQLAPSLTVTEISFDHFAADDVAVQDDGGILFIAPASNQISDRGGLIAVENAGTVVLRMNSDGSIDSAFGDTDSAGYDILGAGSGGQDFAIATLDAFGNLILAGNRYDSVDSVGTTSVIARVQFVSNT